MEYSVKNKTHTNFIILSSGFSYGLDPIQRSSSGIHVSDQHDETHDSHYDKTIYSLCRLFSMWGEKRARKLSYGRLYAISARGHQWSSIFHINGQIK